MGKVVTAVRFLVTIFNLALVVANLSWVPYHLSLYATIVVFAIIKGCAC
jgi:hypothetical protein